MFLLLAGVVLVNSLYLWEFQYPPHSSHDTYLGVPVYQKLFQGYEPEDQDYGFFTPTWFHEPREPFPWTSLAGLLQEARFGRLSGFFRNSRLFGWVDMPLPIGLQAVVATLWPGRIILAELVPTFYLVILLLAIYGIGRRLADARLGLLSACLAAGYPAFFGFSRYQEPHLPVVATGTLLIYLLLASRGLTRWWAVSGFLLLAWMAGHTGESVADSASVALAVAGPLLLTVMAAIFAPMPRASGSPVASWRGLGFRLALLAVALVLGLLLVDLGALRSMAIKVLDGFLDPAVQDDVRAQGGVLGSTWFWYCTYPVLIATDYLKPPMCAWLLLGLVMLPRARLRHRLLLFLWWAVPMVAYTVMHRKASWYALNIVPPLSLATAAGLLAIPRLRLRRVLVGLAATTAISQLVVFTFLPESSVPDLVGLFRDPLPIHRWRLRRVDLLRPVDEPEIMQTQSDISAFLRWMDIQVPRDEHLKYMALVSMAYKHDYPTRYLLGLGRPDLVVVNLVDTRARERSYRGLCPADFDYLVFVDHGFQVWPPGREQREWLSTNIQCGERDPLSPFLGALLARERRLATWAQGQQPGGERAALPPFYLLDPSDPGPGPAGVEPHRVWPPLLRPASWSNLSAPAESRICTSAP